MTIIATDGVGNSSKVTLNATVKDITGPISFYQQIKYLLIKEAMLI